MSDALAPRVYSGRGRASVQRGVACFFLLMGLAGAVGASPEWLAQVLFLAAGAAAFAVIWRVAATRTEANESGVVLHRPVASQRFAWTDIERFVLREPRRSGYPFVPVLVLKTGEDVPLPGLEPAFSLVRTDDMTALSTVIAELNALLTAQQDRMGSGA